MRTIFLILTIVTKITSFSQNIENYTYKLIQSTDNLQIWTTTPANKLLESTTVPNETNDSIKVYCAKNEFEPFKIIIPQITE